MSLLTGALLQYVHRLEFLDTLCTFVNDSYHMEFAPHEEMDRVMEMIPSNLKNDWDAMFSTVMELVRAEPIADVEWFIRQLPPGYLRGECRTEWRNRTK